MKIKVCGLRNPENIEAIAKLKPDYMGFICYDKSPRYVAELAVNLPSNIIKTGVFVNESFDNLVDKINEYDFDAVQLHGDEGVWMCDALKNKRSIIITKSTDVTQGGRKVTKLSTETSRTVQLDKDVIVIKAFGVDDSFDFTRLDAYADSVDLFLFDTKTVGYGGSGKTFNWDILDKYTLSKPFLLSGGINVELFPTRP